MQSIINDELKIDLNELVYYTLNTITYKHFIPKRSLFNRKSQPKTPKMISKIKNKICNLEAIPQAEQRTEAWYMERHQRITASNAYKCLGSESMQNHIIYEKCKPVEIPDAAKEQDAPYVNTTTACHHGQNMNQFLYSIMNLCTKLRLVNLVVFHIMNIAFWSFS